MIQLPEGFDAVTLFNEFLGFATPFVSIGMVIAVGALIINIISG